MSATSPVVYLVPSSLHQEAAHTIPVYVTDAIKTCQVFFVENERSARRFLKKLWSTCLPGQQIVIDDFEWIGMERTTSELTAAFRQKIREQKNIGIISEAGCPGIADPGQVLVAVAHDMHVQVKPLVGPSSVLLALMASGMNGQQFYFAGYLPAQEAERIKAISRLESESAQRNCTQIFIETPYRNDHVVESILQTCRMATRFCIAADVTGPAEWIQTKTIGDWKKQRPSLGKRPAIFLLYAGS